MAVGYGQRDQRTLMTTALAPQPTERTVGLIEDAERTLESYFLSKLQINHELTRALVSFQANKDAPGYRWFKFKEGFSSALVNYVFDKTGVFSGRVIDPFAGSGATLFAASARGLDAVGIELLPTGGEIIHARRSALLHRSEVVSTLRKWIALRPWLTSNGNRVDFHHLRITESAFSPRNECQLEAYLGALKDVKNKDSRSVLRLAALSVLEEISYTRKDGQYLRWDYRSGRRQGIKRFDKGLIKSFDGAIQERLKQFLDDLMRQPDLIEQSLVAVRQGTVEVIDGSCLEELPRLPANSFDALMTSPPYCNRYDYTRTYALELALLGVDDASLRNLRQRMLSCTVENREKNGLSQLFDEGPLARASDVFDGQELLQLICQHLKNLGDAGLLNNTGIPRMVRNYFWEMTLVIFECARVLKDGSPFVMVNDNVRYAGIAIPVDLILSYIAERAGFQVEAIWVLPKGKGNSSQQMGVHGRRELRKCVYIWRATKGPGARQ